MGLVLAAAVGVAVGVRLRQWAHRRGTWLLQEELLPRWFVTLRPALGALPDTWALHLTCEQCGDGVAFSRHGTDWPEGGWWHVGAFQGVGLATPDCPEAVPVLHLRRPYEAAR